MPSEFLVKNTQCTRADTKTVACSQFTNNVVAQLAVE